MMTNQAQPSEPSIPSTSCRAQRRGSITILSAIVALVLIGVVGLGLDYGLVMTARQQLQRTADAAALAAAAEVKKTPAQGQQTSGGSNFNLTRAAAVNTAAAMSNDIIRCGTAGIVLDPNYANTDDNTNQLGDVVVGRWLFNSSTFSWYFDPTNTNTGLPAPDAVKVRAMCRSGSPNAALELFFGSLFGTNTSNVGRYAIARQGRHPDPLILVLHRTRPAALRINGDAYMDVLAGTIQVDSNDPCALLMNGASGIMEAQSTRIVGAACIVTPSNLRGDLIIGAPYVPDPLIGIPAPSTLGMPNRGGITSFGTYLPGYYPNGIDFNSGFVDLESGIYVIGRGGSARGIDLKGDAVIRSKPGGVHLYLEPGANITTTGSRSGLALAPLTSGTYFGVTIFMARTGGGDATIGGNGVFEIKGTLYIPNGQLRMQGDVTREVGQMIVETLLINGNARYVITGEEIRPATGPQFVYLVN